MIEASYYDRIRTWTDNVNITDPMRELCCMMEEFGEIDDADGRQSRDALADAIGDSAVCLISNDYLLRDRNGPFIETQTAPMYLLKSNMNLLGMVAEGIRKPAKKWQALECQITLLERLKTYAAYHGLDFERDCLGLVVPIIESRVATGRLINGTFVKEGDL